MYKKFVGLPMILFLGVFLVVVAPNPSPGAAEGDFLGRWDITIAHTGDTFNASWIEVTRTDGGLSGKILWRWGSVTGVKSVKVVEDELRVTRTESFEDKPVDVVYAAKLVDGKLVGNVKNADGSVFRWEGVRSVEKIDVSGTWQLAAETPRGTFTSALAFKQDGPNVSGKYVAGRQNREFGIKDGKLAGANLTFSISFERQDGGVMTIQYDAKVAGDKMNGTARREGAESAIQFTALRQKKWGNPLPLFEGKDLSGFHSRDPRRDFYWSVKEGVLVNRPPDQDIVSKKKVQDFKLHVEFNLAKNSNSGIYLRGRYELQLVDDYGRSAGNHSNCSIYSRLAPSTNASKPANEWQTVDITLVGRWLTVVLNGQTIHDNVHLDGITGGALDSNEAEPGPLMFQGDHGLVRYRNITVTPLLD